MKLSKVLVIFAVLATAALAKRHHRGHHHSPKPCIIGGCNGEICTDQQDVVSSCLWYPSYACYGQYSTCERQANGECDWTPTDALQECLATTPSGPTLEEEEAEENL